MPHPFHPFSIPLHLSPSALLPPLQLHSAISQDGADVAVAGTRGLAVYSSRARRWRLFGDATQERSLRVGAASSCIQNVCVHACLHSLLLQPSFVRLLLASSPHCQLPTALAALRC